ncbi:hypothetical protein CKO45_31570, partial [Paracraurococcus ruber]|nr:hypothetical protein [Paracraurococcus ruber]
LPGAEGATAALPGGGAEGAEGGALPPGEEGMVSLANVQGQMRASSINNLMQLVEQHPDESLVVIRRWLNPDDAS